MRVRRTLLLVMMLLVPALGLADFGPEQLKRFAPFWELTVRTIDFESSLNLNHDELLSGIVLKEGTPLYENDLLRSVENLNDRGTLASIDVVLQREGEFVDVMFLLSPSRSITQANFPRHKTFDAIKLKRFAGLQLGQPFSLSLLSASQARLKKAYAAEGYYRTHIRTILSDRLGVPGQVVVDFEIDDGEPALIQNVNFVGQIPEALVEVLQKVIARYKGKIASKSQIDNLRKALTKACRDRQYLQASIRLQSMEVSADGAETQLVFFLNARQPVEIVFEGNTALSEEELLAPLRIATRTVPISSGSIENLCDEIKSLYQEVGYYFVKARCERKRKESDEEKRVFLITVEEGSQVYLRSIKFSGNKAISERQLSRVMQTTPRGWWFFKRWRPGYLDQEALADDRARIESLYQERGYLEANARSKTTHSSEDRALDLEVKIKEGVQTLIGSVEIQWSEIMDASTQSYGDELSSLLSVALEPELKNGDPFNVKEMESQRRKLAQKLTNLGFVNADVRLQVDEQDGSVRFIVQPGVRVTIGNIVVQGNRETHDKVISRELEVAPAEVWDVEKIEKSHSRLARLGLFQNVTLKPLDGSLDSPVETLAVSVAERDTGSFSVGAGIDTEDGLRLSGELNQRNLAGSGRSLLTGFDGYVGGSRNILDAGQGHVLFVDPRFLESRVQLLAEAFGQFDVDLIDQYNFDRLGTALMFQTDPAEEFSVAVGFRAYTEDLFDVEPAAILGPDDEGSSFYNFFRLDFDLDRRNDRFNPTKGYHTRLASRLSSTAIGSEVDFYGLALTHAFYTPLGGRYSLVNRFRGEYLHAYGDDSVVPLSSRVFLGGHNTLRGFSKNAVGPRASDGTVVGGDLGLVWSSDFVISITDAFQTALFVDVGQSYLEESDSEIDASFDLSRLRYAPGFGLRYKTPIGPVTADVGFPMDREFGERFARFYFGIGSSF